MQASEEIWHQYHGKLAAFIRSKVAEDVVEDLLQDVFLKIHMHIDSLKDGARLESWIFQITRNAIADYYRYGRVSEKLPEWIEEPRAGEEETIRKELSSCLEPMVKELPAKYRSAIQLSELENKTQREVAEHDGISLSGAKSRVQRGRTMLKAMLFDCCQFEINRHNQVVSYEKNKQGCEYC